MLGKCLWKIHKAKLMSSGESPSQKKTAEVIETFWLALRNSPRRKDPKSQEPLIEPIYKLVVILHKLVLLKAIEVSCPCSNSRTFINIMSSIRKLSPM